jgi:hypothetical protein
MTNLVLLSITLHTNSFTWAVDPRDMEKNNVSTVRMVPVYEITRVATIGWRDGTNIVIYDQKVIEQWEQVGTNVTKGIKP